MATVVLLLAGSVAAGAAPAFADADRVGVKAPGSFTAGTAGVVGVTAVKRSDGCAAVGATLGLALAGLPADQVQVQAAVGGRWVPVPLVGGNGAFSTTPVPAERPLCEKKSAVFRFRVTFLAGAPAGTVDVVGQVRSLTRVLGRATDSSRLVVKAAPVPSVKSSAPPTPSASPVATVAVPTVGPEEGTVAAALPSAAPAAPDDDSGSSGFGTLVALLGVGMVGIGAALLWVLLRRNRGDRDDQPADQGSHTAASYGTGLYGGSAAQQTIVLPPRQPGAGSDPTSVFPAAAQPPSPTAQFPRPFPPPGAGGFPRPVPPRAAPGESTTIMPRTQD
jgi:hypothetical protein